MTCCCSVCRHGRKVRSPYSPGSGLSASAPAFSPPEVSSTPALVPCLSPSPHEKTAAAARQHVSAMRAPYRASAPAACVDSMRACMLAPDAHMRSSCDESARRITDGDDSTGDSSAGDDEEVEDDRLSQAGSVLVQDDESTAGEQPASEGDLDGYESVSDAETIKAVWDRPEEDVGMGAGLFGSLQGSSPDPARTQCHRGKALGLLKSQSLGLMSLLLLLHNLHTQRCINR